MSVKKLLISTLLLAVPFAFYFQSAFADDEFVFLLRTRGNPYWVATEQGIQDSAKDNHAAVSVYFTAQEVAAEEQLNTCMAVIEKKPKLIGIVAANTAAGIECLKKASAKGIAVADLDASIPIDEAEKAGVHLSFSVGADNRLIGEEAAKYAATISGPAPKVLILEGAPGNNAGMLRVGGFRSKFAELVPGAVIIGSVSGEWDRLKAMNITADFVERGTGIDLIFAANDLMGLGAVEALKTHPLPQPVRIVSVDGTADARAALLQGRIAATVAQLPYLMGRKAVELAIAVGKGEHVQQRVITPTPVLTKKMVEDNSDPNLKFIR